MRDTPDSAESTFSHDPVPKPGSTDEAARVHLNHLLKSVGLGDQAEFGGIYHLTASHLFSVAIRMVRDQGEAEDLLQEIFTTVWRRADTFDPTRANAVAWLITMARDRTIDQMRQRCEEALDEEQAIALPMTHRRPPCGLKQPGAHTPRAPEIFKVDVASTVTLLFRFGSIVGPLLRLCWPSHVLRTFAFSSLL